MIPPGYQAPVVKASQCQNKRQERSDRRKAGRKGIGKKFVQLINHPLDHTFEQMNYTFVLDLNCHSINSFVDQTSSNPFLQFRLGSIRAEIFHVSPFHPQLLLSLFIKWRQPVIGDSLLAVFCTDNQQKFRINCRFFSLSSCSVLVIKGWVLDCQMDTTGRLNRQQKVQGFESWWMKMILVGS